VRVLKIKRLRARLNGQPLYQELENIDVDFYVNQQSVAAGSFTMYEEQEAIITHHPVQLRRPAGNRDLVLIFNVRQKDSSGTVDSDFRVHTSLDNFGHGFHTIQVFKAYWQKPVPPFNKPLKREVPAYEITYEIVAPQNAPLILIRR
jgi:hypothetical protein